MAEKGLLIEFLDIIQRRKDNWRIWKDFPGNQDFERRTFLEKATLSNKRIEPFSKLKQKKIQFEMLT